MACCLKEMKKEYCGWRIEKQSIESQIDNDACKLGNNRVKVRMIVAAIYVDYVWKYKMDLGENYLERLKQTRDIIIKLPVI